MDSFTCRFTFENISNSLEIVKNLNGVASGLTAGDAAAYRSNTTDAYLAWSAEL